MQDTGDTRETPAIDVCKGLLKDNARLHIYDPKVSEAQIRDDLATSKFEWDHPMHAPRKDGPAQRSIRVFDDPAAACKVSFLLMQLVQTWALGLLHSHVTTASTCIGCCKLHFAPWCCSLLRQCIGWPEIRVLASYAGPVLIMNRRCMMAM